ncbi:MAG TPA: hypothetical protein PLY09_00065 [Methanothrix sp.]|nr:hypothetical protein [Methanothrix sp.]HPJ83136.1 hypothetical protein [Methanothrix sp.]
MNRKSSCHGIASAMAPISQAVLLLLLFASILGAAELGANEYGEIDERPTVTETATSEDAAVPAGGSEETGAEEADTSGSDQPEEASAFSDLGERSAEDAMAEIDFSASNDTIASSDAEIEEEAEEPTIAEAVVYVFNNDDDTLSVSLFIDSELLGTEDVSKEKEKKFGNYQLEAGSHRFKITWWDDDTKKTHQEEMVATVEDETAVTLYTTQNKEPEEFEVNVMLRNENSEDLEAYLYIDGEYEKQKTAKKESTTDFGKFDLEEGTHELAVRWQDPETKIEYEKRKTVRVDGKDVVTFYAPQGMTFESEDEKATAKTTPSKTAANSKIDTASTKTPSSTTKDDEKDPSSQTGTTDAKQAPSNSGVKVADDRGETSEEEKTPSGDGSEQRPNEKEGDGPTAASELLYLSTIGAILLIYIIFFRR